jgi:predicted transposase YdaD
MVKVISVNILYFDLGHGSDYIYHGATSFTGIHDHDILELDRRQQILYGKNSISNVYPEYYLIKVNNFNSIATTTLDEWIYFFKNQEIKDEFKAKGIQKAKQSFALLSMSDEELRAYNRYQDSLRDEASYVETNYLCAKIEGHEEGLAEGLAEGHAEGLAEGHAEGHEEGLAEGLAEGHAEGLAEGHAEGHEEGKVEGKEETTRTIALNLIQEGVGIEIIKSVTGLSIAVIEDLVKSVQ